MGIALITGSYAIEKKSKIISDAVLAGGLLMLYLTLIFGSRFDAGTERVLIPETWALIIATLFTIGVAFFSYTRRSHYILLIGVLGGYLTPFFIGETGGFNQFINDKGVFHYNLPLPAFLIYFAAINVAVLIVANQFFLRGIGLLNSLGLFIGTISLSFFMGGEFPENASNIAAFLIVIVTLHIGSMCVNAKKFEKETDPYLQLGYLLPLIWFVLSMKSFLDQYLDRYVLAGLLLACSAVYYSGWHYLRRALQLDKHFALYVGMIISFVLALSKLSMYHHHLAGPILATVALCFGALNCVRPRVERAVSFYLFASFATLLGLWHVGDMSLPNLGVLRGTTLLLIYCLSPFLLSYFFPAQKQAYDELRLSSYFAGIFIVCLLFVDLIRIEGLPRSFLFLTLPALIACVFAHKAADAGRKLKMIKISFVLAGMGFFTTFVTIINRFYPFPQDIKLFATGQSLVGLITVLILAVLSLNVKKLRRSNLEIYDEQFDTIWQFMLTLLLYVSLWSTVTHEIMATFNTLNFHVEGLKSFSTTIWWSCLGAYMIFVGVKNSELVDQKNIGFGLLSLTVVKILILDLHHLNTNFKVFVFMLVGILMLAISYMAHKKELSEVEVSNKD